MEMFKAFLGGMWAKAKGLFGWALGWPKRFLCWLHSKLCGC